MLRRGGQGAEVGPQANDGVESRGTCSWLVSTSGVTNGGRHAGAGTRELQAPQRDTDISAVAPVSPHFSNPNYPNGRSGLVCTPDLLHALTHTRPPRLPRRCRCYPSFVELCTALRCPQCTFVVWLGFPADALHMRGVTLKAKQTVTLL